VVIRRMPRVQDVVLPLLRAGLDPGPQIVSWVPNVEQRVYPVVGVRRLGGLPVDVNRLDEPVIELTVYHDGGLVAAEDLYLDCRQVLYNAVQNQTTVDAGYLHSYFETLGPTQFESPYDGSWRVQGLIQLGLRPPRK
jgi:hypothetical protein